MVKSANITDKLNNDGILDKYLQQISKDEKEDNVLL
jgi:hypothetical protein